MSILERVHTFARSRSSPIGCVRVHKFQNSCVRVKIKDNKQILAIVFHECQYDEQFKVNVARYLVFSLKIYGSYFKQKKYIIAGKIENTRWGCINTGAV
jgi:hypothetical protein